MEPSFIPTFANNKSVQLGTEVKALRKELKDAEAELLDNTETICVLKQHVNKELKEVDLASKALAEKSKQFSVEEHLHQLSLRALVRIFTLVPSADTGLSREGVRLAIGRSPKGACRRKEGRGVSS